MAEKSGRLKPDLAIRSPKIYTKDAYPRETLAGETTLKMHHEFCKDSRPCGLGNKVSRTYSYQRQREVLFEHIHENAKEKKIHIVSLGGYTDHVHCLISLNNDETIAKIIQLVKGESSNWANKQNLFPGKLIWAEDYFAASISVGALSKVMAYIKNQEEHHLIKSLISSKMHMVLLRDEVFAA